MRHDGSDSAGSFCCQVPDYGGEPGGDGLQWLGCECEFGGMGEICVHLAGEPFAEIFPNGAGPAGQQPPLRESIIDSDLQTQHLRQRGGGFDRPLQWRRHDEIDRFGRQVGGGGRRLPTAESAEVETRQVCVDQVAGIVDLSVADEMDCAQHER